jgi:N-acyl-L-homoserine lactone synthetase
MLHVLKSGDPLEVSVLRAMFKARKEVFVDLLRWDVPVLGDTYEVDQFDNEHATYLVLAGRDGRHLGSARLLPTMRANILSSLYPMLCEGEVPRSADTYEITRFCLDRDLRASERRLVRDALVTSLVEHALENGIGAYCAVAHMSWFQQILAFGWKCRPLGLPQMVGGTMLAAARIIIEPDTPHRLSAAGIVPAPLPETAGRKAA